MAPITMCPFEIPKGAHATGESTGLLGLAGYFFFCANIMTICLPSISGFCSIDA